MPYICATNGREWFNVLTYCAWIYKNRNRKNNSARNFGIFDFSFFCSWRFASASDSSDCELWLSFNCDVALHCDWASKLSWQIYTKSKRTKYSICFLNGLPELQRRSPEKNFNFEILISEPLITLDRIWIWLHVPTICGNESVCILFSAKCQQAARQHPKQNNNCIDISSDFPRSGYRLISTVAFGSTHSGAVVPCFSLLPKDFSVALFLSKNKTQKSCPNKTNANNLNEQQKASRLIKIKL